MKRTLIIQPEAEAEMAEAADWYEKRGKGLGADFLRAVDSTVAAIFRNPFQYQTVEGELRRAGLRRFPYSLIYIASDRELNIVACFHGHRDPRRWRDRTRAWR
jgi:plasmid stabilization system protein ParE